MKKILFISLAVILALSVGLIGCEGEEGEGEGEGEWATSVLLNPQGYPADPLVEPTTGGTFVILNSGSGPNNIGAPWVAGGGRDGPMGRPAMEKICGMDDDFNIAPQLATAWVEDSVAKTITFTLREGVVFHDGTPFDANAVKLNLDKYKAGSNAELDDMTSCDVVDNYTVELTFSTWNPNMIRNFAATQCGVMASPTYWASHTDEECKLNPVGTGPFEFVSLSGNSLTYAAFDDYWQEGLPYLDGIRIDFVADGTVRYNAFLGEDGDLINELTTYQTSQLEALPADYDIQTQLVHIKGLAGDTLNPGSPFADIRVRQAIAHAIPTTTLVGSTFDNQYVATTQFALPLAIYTGYNSSIVGYPYNVSTAQALMVAAGYNATNRISCSLTYHDAAFDDWYTNVQSYLADIYIDIAPAANPGYYGFIHGPGWANQMVEYQFSYNGFELSYDQSLTMKVVDQHGYALLANPPTVWMDLYDDMLAEMSLTARETMFETLNAWLVDRYCWAMPQFGWAKANGRQPWVRDCGYGQTASEWCPEITWME